VVVGVWRPTGFAGLCAAVLCAAVPAVATAVAAVPAPATAALAARGVSVDIVDVPDELVAGARPALLTVVASRSSGQGCFKLRWSLVVKVTGVALDQVRIDRIEETGSFPVDVRVEDDAARITDERLDPGTLCRNRTVTARYEVAVVAGAPSGRLTLRPEAYDTDLRLLERDETTRSVAGAAPPPTTAPPTTAPPEPTVAAAEPPGAGAGGPAEPAAARGADDEPGGLPLAWFLIGALMMFLGLSLLLNVRWRQRFQPAGPAGRAGSGRRRRAAADDEGYADVGARLRERRTVRYAAARARR
jgi:hypothetical protein